MCRVHSWEVRRIWEPSALRSDLPPSFDSAPLYIRNGPVRTTRNIRARSAGVESLFFFSLSPPPSGGISNFGLFIYLSSAERSTSVDRPSRRSDVPDDNGDTVVRPVRALSITDNRLQL